MPSPIFQFQLRPLDQVQPWGAPEDPNLHWFGLTDGEYWIQAGEHRLFEYATPAAARSGRSRFCDYQVVRLFEDVIDLAPHALEPVPEELQQYIEIDEAKPWNHFWSKWCEAIGEHDVSEETLDLLDNAGSWMGRRQLDSLYLTPSTNVIVWSDSEFVRFQWDNRDKLLHGCQAWSAQHGSWQLSRANFADEVRSFHARLMEQMAQRVSQVAAGALAKSVRVDLEGLRREQAARSQSIERNFDLPSPATDWPLVLASIRSLEARHG